MSGLELLLSSTAGSTTQKTYVDDVFSITTYDQAYSSKSTSIPGVALYNTDEWSVIRSFNPPDGGYGSEIDRILSDATGNIYVLAGRSHIFKLNSSGAVVWSKQGLDNGMRNMAIDSSGNIFIACYKDTGTYGVDAAVEVRVIKLDSSGTVLLNKSIKINEHRIFAGWVTGMSCDASGNVYLVGPSSVYPTYSGYGALLVKLDNNLGFVWAKGAQMSASDANGLTNTSNSRQSLAIGASGNIYVTWGYGYDSSQTSIPLYVSKLSSAGNVIWTRCYGNSNMYSGNLVVDSSDNLYILAYKHLLKLDSNGNILTSKYIQDTGMAKGLCINGSGTNLYIGFYDQNSTKAKQYLVEISSVDFSITGVCARLDSSDNYDLLGGSGHGVLEFVNNKIVFGGQKYNPTTEEQVSLVIVVPTSLKISGSCGAFEAAGIKAALFNTKPPTISTSSAATEKSLGTISVFSTVGSLTTATTYTIANGVNYLASSIIPASSGSMEGGMFWIKRRDAAEPHLLVDTVRGINTTQSRAYTLSIDNQPQTWSSNSIESLPIGGIELSPTGSPPNTTGGSYVSYGFRRAKKFFDIVEWVGDGTQSRYISHSLESTPGLILVKKEESTSDWVAWFYDGGNGEVSFNKPEVGVENCAVNGYINLANSTQFRISGGYPDSSLVGDVNTSGQKYIAYVFGNDTSPDGIVRAGSFTTDSSGNATINLGWEPQFIITKSPYTLGPWKVTDNARGMSVRSTGGYGTRTFYANSTAYEFEYGGERPTSTGFVIDGANDASFPPSTIFRFLAIRIPNKPPSSGYEVLKMDIRLGTGGATSVYQEGFRPDLCMIKSRTNTASNIARMMVWFDRMRGDSRVLSPVQIWSQQSAWNLTFNNGGYKTTESGGEINESSISYINYFLKRSREVFDSVCYIGTGGRTEVAHSLGATPELMIVKSYLGGSSGWAVYHKDLGATKRLYLDSTEFAQTLTTAWNDEAPTSSTFIVGSTSSSASSRYIAYLFASKTGISKVGSYIGNGGSQGIDCGFAAGARFLMIKSATINNGDWFYWDTARGIVSGNDGHLSINTDVAEISSDDSIDPISSGFTVNQNATTNINQSGITYIYLAIA